MVFCSDTGNYQSLPLPYPTLPYLLPRRQYYHGAVL